LVDQTDDYSSGDDLEVVDVWLGGFHGVNDSTDELPLTEKPLQEVQRCIRLYAAGILKIRPYHYAMHGGKITHTREDVYLQACSWTESLQSAQYDAAGFSPLAQECEVWWLAEALSMASTEGWFTNEARGYAALAAECAQDAVKGIVPSAIMPDHTVNQDPVKN
jgi:hypothetical protein